MLGILEGIEEYNNQGALLGIDGAEGEELLGALRRMNPIQRQRTINKMSNTGSGSRGSRAEMEKHFAELPPNIKFYRRCFQRKYSQRGHEFPPFDWQDDFDDQIIRTPSQLQNTLGYIEKQALLHGLPANHFLFITDTIPSDLVFIGED